MFGYAAETVPNLPRRILILKPSWPRIRKALELLDGPALVSVLKELYDLSSANKVVLARHFDPAGTEDIMAPAVRRDIERAFNPSRGLPTFKTGPARKALREYTKAASAQDAIEMELYYVEKGIEGTNAYGDIDEAFYTSVESVWESVLNRILADHPPEADPKAYRPRLERVVASTRGIGWGFHDTLSELFDDFLEKRNV